VDNPNYSIKFSQLYLRDNTLYLPYQQDNSWVVTRTTGRIKMDENGNVQDIISFVIPFAGPIWMIYSKNDPFVASVYNEILNTIGMIRIPPEGYVEWAHNYNVPAYEIQLMSIVDLSSGSYLGVSNYWLSTDYGSSTWLTKVNSAGLTPGCSTDDNVNVGIQHTTLPFADDNLQGADIAPGLQPYHLSVSNLAPVEATVCNGQDVCNTLTLDAHNDICSLGDMATFTANQGNNCTLAIDWSYDTSAASVVSAGPSAISLVFKKPGAFELTGSVQTSCQLLQDKISFQVHGSPNGIDLGPDRVLCTGILDTLHAGKGFMTYLWQDGSTDSTYQVSAPGYYSVTATN
jgi:hypothetical protein